MPAFWTFDIILVDDASTDGTTIAVLEEFPSVEIIGGDGDWFWAKSMAVAEKHIKNFPNLVIWINDDVELAKDSLSTISKSHLEYPDSILVGQLKELNTDQVSYGGLRQLGRHPLKYEQISTFEDHKRADAFHGNFVVVPTEVFKKVAGIDGNFSHAYADFDYALRARKYGFEILIVPGFVGICSSHPFQWEGGMLSRLRFINSKKGLPLKSQIRYLKRHGSWWWPIYLLGPYIRAIFNIPGTADLHKDEK